VQQGVFLSVAHTYVLYRALAIFSVHVVSQPSAVVAVTTHNS